ERIERERRGPGGRTHEIQRLVGRSLRAVMDLTALGERSILIDCDVIEADGGTRTASITGGYVALVLALERLRTAGELRRLPLTGNVAAVSAGIVDGRVLLDLAYAEDSRAEVDLNVVMTGAGRYVEVQGTAEGRPRSPRRGPWRPRPPSRRSPTTRGSRWRPSAARPGLARRAGRRPTPRAWPVSWPRSIRCRGRRAAPASAACSPSPGRGATR